MYTCYWNDILVGMNAILPVPSGNLKHGFRGHRYVVLPDYQGLGIGTALMEFVADEYLKNGNKYYSRATHLKVRNHWNESNKWIPTSHNNKQADKNSNIDYKKHDTSRVCGSYEYMGESYSKLPHIDIYVDYTSDCNLEIIKEDLKYLQQSYYITVITGDVKEDNPIDKICSELGIRTQLLYYRNKISQKNKKQKIITCWDNEFSKKVRRYYNREV